MHTVVSLQNVVKLFEQKGEPRIVAVDHISFEIKKGEIFSLVGPDGAGKTTTIRMMCGVLPPSDGTISLLGLDMRKDKAEIKNHIGYLSQKFSLYGDLTIDENIDFFAEIHRLKHYREKKEELLQFTRLAPFRNRLAAQLSGGMKQKLALACTLVHAPDIIFLDEPTTGVDPVSRRDFWKILSNLLKSGITIVVTTPYLDEAERSTRVALMNEGRILICDAPENIRAGFGFDVFEVVCERPRDVKERLTNLLEPRYIQLFGDRIHLLRRRGTTTVAGVNAMMRKAGIDVETVQTIPPSLEDVFVAAIS